MKKFLLFLSFTFCILHFELANAQIPSYVPTNGLVGWWPFNGNANDESGNGNNGTVNGATLTTDRFGNANGAYSFNGALATKILVTLNQPIASKANKTFSFWVKYPTTYINPYSHIITCDNVIPSYGNSYMSTNGNNSVYVSENTVGKFYEGKGGLYSTSTLNNNSWHHIVLINDFTNLKSLLYIDGRLDTTKTSNNYLRDTIVSKIAFGNQTETPLLTVNNATLLGILDDIAIYNRALTQSEITGLYNAGTNTCLPSYLPTTGLVGYWPFCGNANDESGNGNNGTVNGATLTTDRFGNAGKAYSFDGISNHIEVANNAAINSLTQISISYWINVNQLPQSNIADGFAGCITKWFGAGNCNSNTDHYGTWITSNSEFKGGTRLYSQGSNMTSSQQQIIGMGNWIFVCFVHEENVGGRLYINGNLVSQVPISGSLCSTTNNLYFGCDNGLGTLNRFLNGKLDDIAIYNRALTQQEITQLYTSTLPCTANIIQNDTTICTGSSVTLSAAAVASASVTDINGNVYPTVNIGSQTWMQKNLNVSKYKNGDIIPQVTDPTQWTNLTTGAWCWYNNDSATYGATYGKLYNWYAVNDPRGLAPDGWHVPSGLEWDSLAISVAGGVTNAGGPLKEAGTSHWLSPNTGATNSTRFNGLPGGFRSNQDATGEFYYNGKDAWFFFIAQGNLPGFKNLYYNNNGLNSSNLFGYYNYFSNTTGASVRLIKNTFLPNSLAYTYLWSTGATTQTITVSPTTSTTYYLTVTDANGNTCRDSVRITVNTAIPATPGVITGVTDVCPYFSSTTATTSSNLTYSIVAMSTATSYTWTVPVGVTIVSGQGTNSITVNFANTFVSGAISVKANNACGSSTTARSITVYRRAAATPGTIQKEFSPVSIAATTNVTGLVSETYRIKKVLYATSYNWSLNRGTMASITHVNPLGVNDTAVIVTFVNCFVRDTLSVKSVSPCSVSTARTAILFANTTPATLSVITTVGGDFVACIGGSKTFTAIANTPTSAQAPVASFRWTIPANTVITSATSDSSSITVSFNTGFTGGSISAKGVTACGVVGTAAVSAILQYLPPTPSSIGTSTGSYNACINSLVTYTALVGAPTSSQAPATVFRWTKPNNTTITTASADSSTITLNFNTGYVGGTLSVRGQTRCGTLGTARSQSLTHTGCPTGTKMSVPVTTTDNSFEVSLYPNPSAGEFNLLINSMQLQSKAIVKVIDLQGRLMKSFECNANQVTAIGNELKPGVYMVEVRMGNEVKTVRAVRF